MSRIRKVRVALAVAASAALLLLAVAPSASADTLVIQLNVPNDSLTIYAGDTFATVTLTADGGGTIDVTVNYGTATLNGGQYATFGNKAFGLTLASGLSVSDLIFTNLTTDFSVNAGGAQMDGFGNFALSFTGPTGAINGVSGFSFTVTRSGGFATVSDFLGNSPDAASRLIVILGGDVINTGFVGTPEPGTLILLGTGLLAIGGSLRRRMKL